MKSGQVLILVLLIVVVALAVGLSVASRNIVNLRTSTQTKESQRAFGTAEGGVEDVLSRLTSLSTDASVLSPSGKNLTVSVGDLQANVNVKGSSVYESKVEVGEVAQINLSTFTGTQVQIDWGKGNSENFTDGQPASIEVTDIYGAAPYNQVRWFFQGNSAGRANETSASFSSPSCSTPSAGYTKCAIVSVNASPVLLRIKPYWVNTTVRVAAVGATLLPVQTYDISSSASSNVGVTRAVQVKRTAFPMLPAVFDYAMFSEGDILK